MTVVHEQYWMATVVALRVVALVALVLIQSFLLTVDLGGWLYLLP
jgi:hypothetical protein